MIWPAPRLLWIAALIFVPALTMADLFPAFVWPIAGLLVIVSAVVVWDGIASLRELQSARVSAETALEWFKDRESILPIHLEANRETEIALEMPPEIETGGPSIRVTPGATAHLSCIPRRRGRFEVPECSLGRFSRWGTWRLRVRKPLRIAIRVYPDLNAERGARMLLLKRFSGLRTQRMIGRGREFERLREYLHGDSFDEIYWKATARRSKPVVKVFQIERTQDVYAVIDSSRLSGRNDALEHFVNAALLTALAAENHGDNFGLVTFSNRVNTFVAAARGKNHFARCREAIYDVNVTPMSPDFEELFTFLQLHIRRRSLLLFLTDLSDPILAESFARDVRVLVRRHLAVVNHLRDEAIRPLFSGSRPKSAEQVNERLAGHLQWVKQRDVEKNLNRFGVLTQTLRPETAGFDLVQQYAEIKQRQLL